jgi:hypothetical protein
MDRSGTKDLSGVARLMYGLPLSNVRVLWKVETNWVLLAGYQDVSTLCCISLVF